MVKKMKPSPMPVTEIDPQEVDEMLTLIRSRRKAAKLRNKGSLEGLPQKLSDQNVDPMLAEIRARRKARMSEMSATPNSAGEHFLLRDGFFTANPVSGEWRFDSSTEPKKRGEYNISVSDLIKSPESLCDWLAHISEKNWFDPVKFFEFFRRYRPTP